MKQGPELAYHLGVVPSQPSVCLMHTMSHGMDAVCMQSFGMNTWGSKLMKFECNDVKESKHSCSVVWVVGNTLCARHGMWHCASKCPACYWIQLYYLTLHFRPQRAARKAPQQ